MGCKNSKEHHFDGNTYPPISRSRSLNYEGQYPGYVANGINSTKLVSFLEDTNLNLSSTNENRRKKKTYKSRCFVFNSHSRSWSSSGTTNDKIYNMEFKIPSVKDNLETHTVRRSFSFHYVTEQNPKPLNPTKTSQPQSERIQETNSVDLRKKPESQSGVPDFDPLVMTNFRKTLNEISPKTHQTLRPQAMKNFLPSCNTTGLVQERINLFEGKINQGFAKKGKIMDSITKRRPPNSEDRVVIYYTSLPVVRKSYEDSCEVRLIFRSFQVRTDERDLSMHRRFVEELKLLGFVGVPRIFIKGRYVGGAAEVRELNESGLLEKLLEGCDLREPVSWNCCLCGNIRFVPCLICHGSCKVYDRGEAYGDFKRCSECNENGIIRCPVCCSTK